MLDKIAKVAAILGSLITGLSILLSLHVYRATTDREEYSRIRLSLVDLSSKVEQLDLLLAEPVFTETGINIAVELKTLFDAPVNRELLIAYFANPANHNFIAQSIHLGRQRSEGINRVRSLTEEVSRSPFEYREQLPLVASVITSLDEYLVQVAEGVVSPRHFNNVLNDPKLMGRLLKEHLPRSGASELMFREIALILVGSSKAVMRGQGQDVFDSAQGILDIVVTKISSMQLADIRKESIRQRGLLSRIAVIDGRTHADDVYSYMNLMRDLFSKDEWDKIVELKTKLGSSAHPRPSSKAEVTEGDGSSSL